jgi:hypothetical protein
MIGEGNPILAGQYVQHCIRPFAASAYAVWENVEGSIEAHHNGQRSRGRRAGLRQRDTEKPVSVGDGRDLQVLRIAGCGGGVEEPFALRRS